jgi:hypothetical protein
MARYRVDFEKTTGNGKPSKTSTQVNVNSVAEARAKVLSQGNANTKINIIAVYPIK